MTEPFFLKPYFQPKIWGGRKLESFGYDLPDGKIGECWAISAHPHGPATIKNGPLAGKTLAEAYSDDPEYFGNPSSKVFPLLTKILDAEDSLSVQVHPDDKYAAEHEHELGKTECWYVISAEPGSYLIYGHHAKTHEELVEMIENGQWDKLLRKVPVKAGDFFYVPSGTIHALTTGIMVLETQQSSDTTYRLYDYDRTDDQGHKRELHLKQSEDVTTVPHVDPKLDITSKKVGNSTITTLVTAPISKFFSVYHLNVDGDLKQAKDAAYSLFSILDGEGTLTCDGKTFAIKKGDHFLIPNQVQDWTLSGKLDIVESTPGAEE